MTHSLQQAGGKWSGANNAQPTIRLDDPAVLVREDEHLACGQHIHGRVELLQGKECAIVWMSVMQLL